MKKIFLFLSVITLALVSCSNKSFTVEGKFTSGMPDSTIVYLYLFDADSLDRELPNILDSAIVKNNTFKLKGSVKDIPSMGMVTIGHIQNMRQAAPNTPSMAPIVLEPGTINLSFDKAYISVSGTPKNDELNKVHDLTNQVMKAYEDASSITAPDEASLTEADKAIIEKTMAKQKELQNTNYEFVKSNIASNMGKFMFLNSMQNFSRDQLDELIELCDTAFVGKTPQLKQVKEMLVSIKEKEANVVNKPVKEAAITDTNGKAVNLTSYVGNGKIVLIDFWASWCQPCLREVPTLKKAYQEYKDKGFEIVAVSLDEDKKAWADAVKAYEMSWIQLHDSDKNAANAYEIASIPYTLLVNRDGTVIAMNLRGDELLTKLESLFK